MTTANPAHEQDPPLPQDALPEVPSAGAVEAAGRVRLLVMAPRRRDESASLDPDDRAASRAAERTAQEQGGDKIGFPLRRRVILAGLDSAADDPDALPPEPGAAPAGPA